MPCGWNPPYLLPGDPGWRSPRSSPPLDAASEASYDDNGQPRWGGVGQGAPLDENGRYIHSQIGMPIFPITPPPIPSIAPPAAAEGIDLNTPRDDQKIYADTVSERVVGHSRSKKRRFEDFESSLPQTPCRQVRTRDSLESTNTPRRIGSMPLVGVGSSPASKRRRLQAPFGSGVCPYTSRVENLQGTMKVLQRDMKVALRKQTEILTEILAVLREKNKEL